MVWFGAVYSSEKLFCFAISSLYTSFIELCNFAMMLNVPFHSNSASSESPHEVFCGCPTKRPHEIKSQNIDKNENIIIYYSNYKKQFAVFQVV